MGVRFEFEVRIGLGPRDEITIITIIDMRERLIIAWENMHTEAGGLRTEPLNDGVVLTSKISEKDER